MCALVNLNFVCNNTGGVWLRLWEESTAPLRYYKCSFGALTWTCAHLGADDVDSAPKTTSAITDFRVSGFLFKTYSYFNLQEVFFNNQVNIQSFLIDEHQTVQIFHRELEPELLHEQNKHFCPLFIFLNCFFPNKIVFLNTIAEKQTRTVKLNRNTNAAALGYCSSLPSGQMSQSEYSGVSHIP